MTHVVIEIRDDARGTIRTEVEDVSPVLALAGAVNRATRAHGLTPAQRDELLGWIEATFAARTQAESGSGSPLGGPLEVGRTTYGTEQARTEAGRQSSGASRTGGGIGAQRGWAVPQGVGRADRQAGWQPPWRRPTHPLEVARWHDPKSRLHVGETVELPELSAE